MIKVVKASAGSGKTYTLSHSYLDLLFAKDKDGRLDSEKYKHILAVTFTNKATDEMKGRILKDLFDISKNPSDVRASDARVLLHKILHDYSAFNVSTIDKFFQKVLRNFARELGQYTSYRVELDKKAFAGEVVDSILDSLDSQNPDDQPFIDYITEAMEDKLSNGKAMNVESDLKEMASKLKSEEFIEKSRALGINPPVDFAPDKLKEIRRTCIASRQNVLSQLKARAKDILDAMSELGLGMKDFSRAWPGVLEKIVAVKSPVEMVEPTTAFLSKSQDPDVWFTKDKQNNPVFENAKNVLAPKFSSFADCWIQNKKLYVSTGKVLGSLYGLGIAGRLFDEFEKLQKEKNIVCLDESNSLLKDIIAGSDAPFVYEKVGTYIDNYLLDEFQDTSRTQWANFKPLLEESEANADNVSAKNLIVGDIKQSIYRWRESDWTLLANELSNSFPKIQDDHLKCNFRSDQQIIDFNNAFYPYAAKWMDENYGDQTGTVIQNLYSDCNQKAGKNEQNGKGYVEISLFDKSEEQLDAIYDIIQREVVEHGARYGDIAILVRKNIPGTKIAQFLIDKQLKVVTDAALCQKNSLAVRTLVSLMHFVNDPSDKVNTYIADKLCLSDIPSDYHSLSDLSQKLCEFCLSNEQTAELFKNEYAYVMSFVDYVMDYVKSNGNNLAKFLEKWDDDKTQPTVSSPSDPDAVRILTIHKSKGLDFQYVIVPFVEDICLFDPNDAWLQPEIEDTSCLGGKLFNLSLSKALEDSFFSGALSKEQFDQYVDAINLMYVATTRARKGMSILSSPDAQSMGTILDKFLNEYHQWHSIGNPCDYSDMEKETSVVSYLLDPSVNPVGQRLSVRPFAADFFLSSSNAIEDMDFRMRGIVIHDILSRVIKPEELSESIDEAIADGSLALESRERVSRMLSKRIEAHPEFYPSDGSQILTEASFVALDGSMKRPDRVIIHPDNSVLIVDYKTGHYSDQYARQLNEYKEIFLAMGHPCVETCLWFLGKNEIIKI